MLVSKKQKNDVNNKNLANHLAASWIASRSSASIQQTDWMLLQIENNQPTTKLKHLIANITVEDKRDET